MAASTGFAAEHWYTIESSVSVRDLAEVCRHLGASVTCGRLLVFFDSIEERDDFERRCAEHIHLAVRNIKRVPETPESEVAS